MTREDIECIIKWFSHIEQLATDGKTANGFQMPPDKILATIKVVAKDSREYIEKFCNDSVPNDLEEAANEYAQLDDKGVWKDGGKYKGFIAGAKWHEEQDLAEMAQSKSPLLVAYANRCFENGKQAMKEQMFKEAVEGYVNYYEDSGGILMAEAQVGFPYHNGDKVRIIVLPKEDEK